jgi:hypothetical protein
VFLKVDSSFPQFVELPIELQLAVVNWLSLRDILAMRLSNKRMKALVDDETVWKSMHKYMYGNEKGSQIQHGYKQFFFQPRSSNSIMGRKRAPGEYHRFVIPRQKKEVYKERVPFAEFERGDDISERTARCFVQ